jgi:hypothetical protein
MDWKEGLKWVAVIAAGGTVAAVMELLITGYVKQQAQIAAQQQIQTLLAQAAQAKQARAQTPPPPSPQENSLGYPIMM